jgi:hypothetical protein
MKIAEDARKFLVKPLNDHVATINAKFKETLTPLAEAENTVKAGMTQYRESDAFKIADEKRKTLEMEARAAMREGDTAGLRDIAVQHAEVASETSNTIATNSGKVSYRNVQRMEIVDAEAVPREFLAPDEKKIMQALKAGALIPGIKSWIEKVPSISTSIL